MYTVNVESWQEYYCIHHHHVFINPRIWRVAEEANIFKHFPIQPRCDILQRPDRNWLGTPCPSFSEQCMDSFTTHRIVNDEEWGDETYALLSLSKV